MKLLLRKKILAERDPPKSGRARQEKGRRQRASVSTNMRENIGDSHSGADEYLRQPLYVHKHKAGHTPGLS